MSSSAELAYTLEGAAHDFRDDGRSRLDFRAVSIELGVFPQASGSARVTLGATDILIGVVAELSTPDALAPDAGRILMSVSGGPAELGLPDYGCADRLGWLESSLAALYSPRSIAAALRPLCIVKGSQCWQLRVHAQLLHVDGCPLDALALGVRAALHSTQVPRMGTLPDSLGVGVSPELAAAGNGSGGKGVREQMDLDLDESLDESTPFDASSLPLFVTVASLGGHLVADCSAAERRASGFALSLGLSAGGEVCAVRAGGLFGLNLLPVADMLQTARLLCGGLLDAAARRTGMSAKDAQLRGFPHEDGGAIGLLA
jgi:exosome complex component RRP42